jgi:spore coat polysaccharide biosynthesis protein SpsF (cytidylyltransferase family)
MRNAILGCGSKERDCVAILQARMNSTRLPGKVMRDVAGKPMLGRVLDQLGRATRISRIVVATSDSNLDDQIADFCHTVSIPCFRGSEDDVLDRYFQSAVSANAQVIVRLTGDCPLLDPRVVDRCVETFLNGGCDYVSNTIHRTYPDGLDTEVFSFEALERAHTDAKWKSEREHVTPYIWKNPNIFRLGVLTGEQDYSDLRWTVDCEKDLAFARAIWKRLGDRPASLEAVLQLLEKEPQLKRINSGIDCNEGYLKSVVTDSLISHVTSQ